MYCEIIGKRSESARDAKKEKRRKAIRRLTFPPFNLTAPPSSTKIPLHSRRIKQATSIERGERDKLTEQMAGMLRQGDERKRAR